MSDTSEFQRVGLVAKRTSPEALKAATEVAEWLSQRGLEVDCDEERYSVSVDGVVVQPDLDLEDNPESIDRLVFRTGAWRMDVRQSYMDRGEPAAPGVLEGDLPGADIKTAPSSYLIDDVRTEPF